MAQAINDLRYWSGWHEAASKVVEAYGYIRTFIELKTGYAAIMGANAATVTTKSGLRATVLKNPEDFMAMVAKKETVDSILKETFKEIRGSLVVNLRNALSYISVKNVSKASELALYFDSLNSGKGTLKALYEMNDKLDKEYNELIEKRRAIEWGH